MGQPGLPAPSPSTRRSMQANQPGHTSIELALRQRLRANRLRPSIELRLQLSSTLVRPDLVFRRAKIAIFVNGCFWHLCASHASWPTQNGGWWRNKLIANARRDARQLRALRKNGWTALTIWEHEGTDHAVNRIRRHLTRRSSQR